MFIYGKVYTVLSSAFHSLPYLDAVLGLVLVEVSRYSVEWLLWGVEVGVRGYYSVTTYRTAWNWVPRSFILLARTCGTLL